MKKLFFIALVCLVSMTTFAQEKNCEKQCKHDGKCENRVKGAQEWMNMKREQRRAFIIKEMDLTDTEEAAFVALYDDYNKKISVSKRGMNKAMRALNDSISDEEFEKNLDVINAQELEQAKITDKFYNAMKKALPIRKVYLYFKADKEFNKLMMKDMQPKKKKIEK